MFTLSFNKPFNKTLNFFSSWSFIRISIHELVCRFNVKLKSILFDEIELKPSYTSCCKQDFCLC